MKHRKYIIIAVFAAFFLAGTSSLHAQWSADSKISVTDTNASLNENMGQCIAVSGDSVHIIWSDRKTDSNAIYYRHSYDAGVTWSPVSRVSNFSKSVDLPSIAVCGSTVHITWRDNTTTVATSYYRRSLDGGNTWGNPFVLGTYVFWPNVTCSGSLVIIGLNDSHTGNSEVYIRRSTDNGTTWSDSIQISHALDRSEDQSIATAGGYVHMVWNDKRSGIMQTYYCRSTNNGATWGAETQFTHTTGFAYFPFVHTSGSNVDVTWGERSAGGNIFDIFFRTSSDYGATWSTQQQLTHGTSSSVYPTITRDGNNIHMVWGTFGGDLYYEHSGDGGVTWDALKSLVSVVNKPGSGFIVVSAPLLHVIWLDQREGHAEVYYKRNPAGNPIANFIVPNSADFGNIKIGTGKDTMLMLRNFGTTKVNILKYSLFDPNNGFMLSDTSVHSINAHDSAPVKVHFNPLKVQSYSGIITMMTDESSSNSHGIMLSGAGVDGKFSAIASIDFGDVKLGGMRDTAIILQNSGAAPMNITGYFLTDQSNGFVILDTLAHTIAANGNAQIKIRFNAVKEQSYQGTVTITTDESALATHRISLIARGVNSNIMLGQSQIDFGNVDTGSTAQKTFTIKNMGSLSATIDSLEIRGGVMFLIAPTQFPLALAPGSQSIIPISFSPHQVGPAQAELWMKTSVNGWAFANTLIGNGITKKDTQAFVQKKNSLLNIIEVIPNPVSTNATLKISTAKQLEDVKINFYDVAGRLLSCQNAGVINEGMQNVSLILPKITGVVLLRITSGGEFIGTTEVVRIH